jgi:hypothetical protein
VADPNRSFSRTATQLHNYVVLSSLLYGSVSSLRSTDREPIAVLRKIYSSGQKRDSRNGRQSILSSSVLPELMHSCL